MNCYNFQLDDELLHVISMYQKYMDVEQAYIHDIKKRAEFLFLLFQCFYRAHCFYSRKPLRYIHAMNSINEIVRYYYVPYLKPCFYNNTCIDPDVCGCPLVQVPFFYSPMYVPSMDTFRRKYQNTDSTTKKLFVNESFICQPFLSHFKLTEPICIEQLHMWFLHFLEFGNNIEWYTKERQFLALSFNKNNDDNDKKDKESRIKCQVFDCCQPVHVNEPLFQLCIIHKQEFQNILDHLVTDINMKM